MIKALAARIKRLERKFNSIYPQKTPGIFTNRTTRGVTRRPSAKGNGGGSGDARWA